MIVGSSAELLCPPGPRQRCSLRHHCLRRNPNIKTKVLTDKITWPTGGRVDTQAKTTYNISYTCGSTRPAAPTTICLQNLSYDENGNQTASELDQLTKEVDSSYTNTSTQRRRAHAQVAKLARDDARQRVRRGCGLGSLCAFLIVF